jgi:hypothetical protein
MMTDRCTAAVLLDEHIFVPVAMDISIELIVFALCHV